MRNIVNVLSSKWLLRFQTYDSASNTMFKLISFLHLYKKTAVFFYVSTSVLLVSSVDTLRELHLLPVQWRIIFKLASLAFKATHNEVSPYLARLLTPYRPSRVFKSSFSSNLLQVPRTNLTFGSRSFRAAAPTVWNCLRDSICSSNIHLTLSGTTWKHTISKLLLIPPSGKPQRLWFTCD